MKVITVTFHYSINYGAVLQCYALQKKIMGMGYETAVLNYTINELYREQHIFNITLSKNIIKKMLSFIKQGLRYLIHYSKNLNQIQRERKFKIFLKKNIKLTHKFRNSKEANDYINKIPAVIIGSDQVWNPRITRGYDDIYYLKSYLGKKISYAASIGEEQEDSHITNEYFNLISQFEHISVREDSGKLFLKKKMDNYIEVNIDPVFLLKKDDYLRIAKNIKEKDYVLVYSVEENNDFLEIVNRMSDKLNVEFIALNKDSRYNKSIKYFNAGVDEFLGLIKNAKFILTNSFHGVAFSLIFEKEFWVYPHSKRPERVANLLAKLEISNRIIEKNFNTKNMINNLDYSKINGKIEQEIKKSEEYLKRTLGE